MKYSAALLLGFVSLSAFAAGQSHCPVSAAIDAAQNEYASENFGEQGAEKAALFKGVTSTNKEMFIVTIDGTDNGNSISEYVVYLAPGSCKLTDAPKRIKNN